MVKGGFVDGAEIIRRRLANQFLAGSGVSGKSPGDVVRWFGAIQAQEYLGALWAMGVRLPGMSEGDVERSVDEGRVLRTWPMRGTIHLVPSEDAKWMLDLLTPRVVSSMAGRHRQLGLDEKTFARSEEIIHAALRGGKAVARKDLMALLDSEGFSTKEGRGYHVLWRLAQEGFLCFGPRRGKQPTFVLLDEWAPEQRNLDRDEALIELAGRYFRSHGPATMRDFVWWSGLTVADAKVAIENVEEKLVREGIGDETYFSAESAPPASGGSHRVHLLPPFDEYTVAYRDRSAALDPAHAKATQNGLTNTIILDGRIIGAWKRKLAKESVSITTNVFHPIGKGERDALEEAANRYAAFLGKKAVFRDS
jgi:hypothetical protein